MLNRAVGVLETDYSGLSRLRNEYRKKRQGGDGGVRQ